LKGSILKPVSIPVTSCFAKKRAGIYKCYWRHLSSCFNIHYFIPFSEWGLYVLFSINPAPWKAYGLLRYHERKGSLAHYILGFLFHLQRFLWYGRRSHGFLSHHGSTFLVCRLDCWCLSGIFGGTQVGTLSPLTTPFSTIIASNAAS